jgi:hypothetical protein
MTIAQIVCMLYTTLSIFGFGVTVGRAEQMEDWQFAGYLVLIVLGLSGSFL